MRRRIPDTYELAGELGRLLGGARRLLLGLAARRLEKVGESVHTWTLLTHVIRQRGASQRELSTLTTQHPAGVSRALLELERRGLVARHRCPQDARKVRVEATPAGQAFYQRVYPDVVHAIDEALAPLDGDERATLAHLLEKLVPSSPAPDAPAPSPATRPARRAR